MRRPMAPEYVSGAAARPDRADGSTGCREDQRRRGRDIGIARMAPHDAELGWRLTTQSSDGASRRRTLRPPTPTDHRSSFLTRVHERGGLALMHLRALRTHTPA